MAVPRIYAPQTRRDIENLPSSGRCVVHSLCGGDHSRIGFEFTVSRERHPKLIETIGFHIRARFSCFRFGTGMEVEDSSLANARGPPRGHCLEASVEAHALHAMYVMITEQRAFPTTEGMIRHRHRDRHIYANHADFHAAEEITSSVAITGKDRGAVPVFVGVDHIDRFFVALGSDDRDDGPEDLILVNGHLGGHIVEQAAAKEVALLVALKLQITSIHHKLRTGSHTFGDVSLDALQCLAANDRAHIRLWVGVW